MKDKFSKTILAIIFAMALGFLTPAAQAEDPSGTVLIESTSIALGVGVQWGGGTLVLNDGTTKTFKVEGLSVLDLGASKVKAFGKVFGLTDLADFPGDYSAIEASATLGKASKGDLIMKNKKEVILHLSPEGEGVQLTAAAKGMIVSFK